MKKKQKKKRSRPIWYITDFFCDDKLVLQIGGTKKKIIIENWSGNHPIFSISKDQKYNNDDFNFFLV